MERQYPMISISQRIEGREYGLGVEVDAGIHGENLAFTSIDGLHIAIERLKSLERSMRETVDLVVSGQALSDDVLA